MKKVWVSLAIAFMAAASCNMTVWAEPAAAEEDMEFDAQYYAENNPDVTAVIGTDAAVLHQHYLLFGKAEGREGAAPDINSMDYNRQVMELCNGQRNAEGVVALVYDKSLEETAEIRAKELPVAFSHTRPDGSSALDMIPYENGIRYRGENIASGFGTPQSVVEGWMGSKGHRENILNGNYSRIGVGYYVDEKGYPWWVQLFAG